MRLNYLKIELYNLSLTVRDGQPHDPSWSSTLRKVWHFILLCEKDSLPSVKRTLGTRVVDDTSK